MAGGQPYGLTAAQRAALLAIMELSAGGVAPSLAEIGRRLGTSAVYAYKVACVLRERGHIDWLANRPRSIVVRRPITAPDRALDAASAP